MQLTAHFSLEEMAQSATAARHGLDNTPTGAHLENLKRTADLMEMVRAALSGPVRVTSGYRAYAVNCLVGGVTTSAHCKGLACDFTVPNMSCYDAAVRLQALPWLLNFDQLILEYGWVHIGLPEPGKTPRRQVLTKKSAAAPYVLGLVK